MIKHEVRAIGLELARANGLVWLDIGRAMLRLFCLGVLWRTFGVRYIPIDPVGKLLADNDISS